MLRKDYTLTQIIFFLSRCSISVFLHILLLLFSYLIKKRFHSCDYTFAKSWDPVSILEKFFLNCHALDTLELCDSSVDDRQ